MPNYMFHLQFPTPEFPTGLIFDSFFESLDGFSAQVWSSATFTLLSDYLYLLCADVLNSRCLLLKRSYYPRVPLVWDKDRELDATVNLWNPGTSNELFRVITGKQDIPCGFGFEVLNGELKGWSANGSNTRTVLLETLPATNYNLTKRLRAKYYAGSRIDFYIDEIYKGQITDRLPTGINGPETLIWLEAKSLDTTGIGMKISEYKVTQNE